MMSAPVVAIKSPYPLITAPHLNLNLGQISKLHLLLYHQINQIDDIFDFQLFCIEGNFYQLSAAK